jgi:hypothetical protein
MGLNFSQQESRPLKLKKTLINIHNLFSYINYVSTNNDITDLDKCNQILNIIIYNDIGVEKKEEEEIVKSDDSNIQIHNSLIILLNLLYKNSELITLKCEKQSHSNDRIDLFISIAQEIHRELIIDRNVCVNMIQQSILFLNTLNSSNQEFNPKKSIQEKDYAVIIAHLNRNDNNNNNNSNNEQHSRLQTIISRLMEICLKYKINTSQCNITSHDNFITVIKKLLEELKKSIIKTIPTEKENNILEQLNRDIKQLYGSAF